MFSVVYTPTQRFYGVELPWRDNRQDVSAIPADSYQCRWVWSPHFQRKTYQVMAVPGRLGIRLHVANFASELLGCIALGRQIVQFKDGRYGVANSGTSMRKFVREMGQQPFELDIYSWAAEQAA